MPLPQSVRGGTRLLLEAVVSVAVAPVPVASGRPGASAAARGGAARAQRLQRLLQQVGRRVGAAQQGARLGDDGGEAGRGGRGGGGGRRGGGKGERGSGGDGRVVAPSVLPVARCCCASSPVAVCWNCAVSFSWRVPERTLHLVVSLKARDKKGSERRLLSVRGLSRKREGESIADDEVLLPETKRETEKKP